MSTAWVLAPRQNEAAVSVNNNDMSDQPLDDLSRAMLGKRLTAENVAPSGYVSRIMDAPIFRLFTKHGHPYVALGQEGDTSFDVKRLDRLRGIKGSNGRTYAAWGEWLDAELAAEGPSASARPEPATKGGGMAKYPTRKRIFDLAGEGQRNADGRSRQDELRICQPGELVTLVREPGNPHDPNAVRVESARGVCLGYLPREDAAAIAPALDAGRVCEASLNELRGGLPDYPNFGCRIALTWEGQQPMEPKPLRPEQTLYGREPSQEGSKRSGCAGVVLMVLLIPALVGAGLAIA